MPTGTVGHAIPNLNRPRQYLERFPLDSLSMVGTIYSHGTWYALIKDPNGLIHRVTDGDYLGQDDGKIVSISTGGVELRELLPNGTGGWVSERAYLPLSLASGGQLP
jgi:type IV pilus assembly protein PilP